MTRGGRRLGAGRPKGHGKYGSGVATTTMRVPTHMVEDVRNYAKSIKTVPLYQSEIGMADTSLAAEMIDLNHYLIKNPANTFCVKVFGESMIEAGIYEGDLLIADKSIEAKHDQIVIASLEGVLTVRRFVFRKDKQFLLSTNPLFPATPVNESTDVHIWGVVIKVVHSI